MQGDTVALAVDHDGAVAVRANLMNILNKLTTAGSGRPDRLGQAPLGIQVHQRTGLGRCIVRAGRVQTTAYLIARMRQQAKHKTPQRRTLLR